MMRAPARPYYLYDRPYKHQQLNLGTLVLGKCKYTDPVGTRMSFTDENLFREEEIENLAWVFPESGRYEAESQIKIGININIAQFAYANAGHENSYNTAVQAGNIGGRRLELKNVPHFLDNVVLKSASVLDQLEEWCTVDNKVKAVKNKIGRGPHLWMLTGLIELQDAKVVSRTENGPSFGAGVDPAVVLAASSGLVPVGASADVNVRKTVNIDTTHIGMNVWAARYEKLNAKYFKKNELDKGPSLTLKPHPELSEGMVRAEKDDAVEPYDQVYIEVVENDDDAGLEEEGEEGTEYWSLFQRYQGRYEVE